MNIGLFDHALDGAGHARTKVSIPVGAPRHEQADRNKYDPKTIAHRDSLGGFRASQHNVKPHQPLGHPRQARMAAGHRWRLPRRARAWLHRHL